MLRWAILGTGFISNTVIEAIGLSNGSSVELIAGRDPAKVADFQHRHGIPRAAGYGDAIADSDIDAVYIGLPNHQHSPYVIAANQVGKAVLSEKSLTATLASAKELISTVQSGRAFFVEGLMYLAHPVHRRLGELLLDGRLGELRSINARYGANIAHLVNPAGRGTIYNLGCYPVSLTHFVVQTLLGEAAFANRSLTGLGAISANDGTVCDAALAIRFGINVLATIQSSDNYGNTSEFSIAGDNGVLRCLTNPWLPLAGANVIEWHPHDGDAETIVVDDPNDAFYHQIKMVERHVAAGDIEATRPSPRHQDSLEIMTVLTEWEALCLGLP